MTPCGGDAFESTMQGVPWQNPSCYWCKKSIENGGKCEVIEREEGDES